VINVYKEKQWEGACQGDCKRGGNGKRMRAKKKSVWKCKKSHLRRTWGLPFERLTWGGKEGVALISYEGSFRNWRSPYGFRGKRNGISIKR